MDLAPVILFVYNRPFHTRQTLERLALNELADQSVLYIFADGPKANATGETLNKIKQTREVIQEKKWCKEVYITEAETNQGLSASVIKGITEIIQKHGKAIVLEDDILTAKGFLKFMNESLSVYENETTVAGISGWSYPMEVSEETYFSRVGSCWGWATWNRAWKDVNFNSPELIEKLKQSGRIDEYNVEGAYDFYSMLNKQAKGELESWAVRFYTDYFLKNGLFLFPQKSLVRNTGFDGTGTNHTVDTADKKEIGFEKEFISVSYLRPFEKEEIRKKIIRSLQAPQKRKPFLEKLFSGIKGKLK